MLQDAKDSSARFAEEESIEVEFERIWNIEPILFHDELVGFADEAIGEVGAGRTGCRAGHCTTPPRSPEPGSPR